MDMEADADDIRDDVDDEVFYLSDDYGESDNDGDDAEAEIAAGEGGWKKGKDGVWRKNHSNAWEKTY